MKTVTLFRHGRSQAVRIPKAYEFEGVCEVEITRNGDALVLRPSRKTWTSFTEAPFADANFLVDRTDIVSPRDS